MECQCPIDSDTTIKKITHFPSLSCPYNVCTSICSCLSFWNQLTRHLFVCCSFWFDTIWFIITHCIRVCVCVCLCVSKTSIRNNSKLEMRPNYIIPPRNGIRNNHSTQDFTQQCVYWLICTAAILTSCWHIYCIHKTIMAFLCCIIVEICFHYTKYVLCGFNYI